MWRRRGVVVITTAQLPLTNPELKFCRCSNPAHNVSEICDGENLLEWSQLEVRLNTFRQSTIPQKTSHHHHHHQHHHYHHHSSN